MPVSTILLKLLKKKSLILVGGISQIAPPGRRLTQKLESILDGIQFQLTDTILVVSKGFVRSSLLAKYEKKIFETPIIFLDVYFLRRFHFSLPSSRNNVVGFVGRFSWEKGIMKFATSLPLIASKRDDVSFMIIGDGELKDILIEKLNSIGLTESVRLLPWITDIETYLQDIKLLIIPSEIEGLPSIMLEAMASGTLVLATSVGAIPDVIKEGNTGFLLKSNNPQHIADVVTVLLNRPELLEKVSINAYRYVEENFRYERALECWRRSFSELGLDEGICEHQA
jgi:glycosyltransferase involved in cell wall biosynthesis